MFCPYIRKIYTRGTIIKYDENDREEGSIISEYFENVECKKEQCGVWHKGKCRYNGGENG